MKPDTNDRPVCWACGIPAPKQNHLVTEGWHSRWERIEGQPMKETYCPDCFAEWGWPVPIEKRMEAMA